MSNTQMIELAKMLADVLARSSELKDEAGAIIDAAKDQGVNVKALRKVAKELTMDSEKLRAKYEDEEQLDMFRAEVGIFKMKGIHETEKSAAAERMVGEKKLVKAAKEFDAFAGTDIAESYNTTRKAVNKHFAGRAAGERE